MSSHVRSACLTQSNQKSWFGGAARHLGPRRVRVRDIPPALHHDGLRERVRPLRCDQRRGLVGDGQKIDRLLATHRPVGRHQNLYGNTPISGGHQNLYRGTSLMKKCPPPLGAP